MRTGDEVDLAPITDANVGASDLTVAPGEERFVAPNRRSAAQSHGRVRDRLARVIEARGEASAS